MYSYARGSSHLRQYPHTSSRPPQSGTVGQQSMSSSEAVDDLSSDAVQGRLLTTRRPSSVAISVKSIALPPWLPSSSILVDRRRHHVEASFCERQAMQLVCKLHCIARSVPSQVCGLQTPKRPPGISTQLSVTLMQGILVSFLSARQT